MGSAREAISKAGNVLSEELERVKNHGPEGKKCVASYGAAVGDDVCCGQPGTVTFAHEVCEATTPICSGYIKDKAAGICQANPGNNPKNEELFAEAERIAKAQGSD